MTRCVGPAGEDRAPVLWSTDFNGWQLKGRTVNEYDELYRVTKEMRLDPEGGTYQVSSAYDRKGNRTRVTQPDGRAGDIQHECRITRQDPQRSRHRSEAQVVGPHHVEIPAAPAAVVARPLIWIRRDRTDACSRIGKERSHERREMDSGTSDGRAAGAHA